MRDTGVPTQASLLRGLPGLVSELGGSGEEFLATYGLDVETYARRDAFISLRLLERILEDAARQLDTGDFGLRMAAQQDLQILGPLAIAMENSNTVGEALECASRFLFIFSPAFSHTVIPDPMGIPDLVGIRFASSATRDSVQVIDYGVGIVHRVLGLIGGGHYGLRSVQLPHTPLAPERVYREYFGAEVWFGRREAVLRVPRHFLDVPISSGNDVVHDIAIDFLETHFRHQDVPVSELVSVLLDGHLAPDQPDLAKVARLLNLHPRSLQRALAKEGIGFKDLIDRVRREQALRLITTTDMSLSQIATRVGLREQSSLTRAVRRWFGVSPSRLRREDFVLPSE